MTGQIPPRARPLPLRSRMELGVCQNCTPACPSCTCHAAAQTLAASVQASRDTGCCCVLGDAERDFKESLSPIERIAYWASVGAAVGLSVATFFGSIGYFSVKAFGL